MIMLLGNRYLLLFARGAAVIGCSAVAGCGGLVAALAGVNTSDAPPVAAENPIRGPAARAEVTPRQVALDGLHPDDCTMWPVRDLWTVKATPAEICVTAVRNYASEVPPPTDTLPKFSFVGDGGKAAPIAMKAEQGTKVGRCTKRVDNMAPETHSVWRQTFSGCAANGGLVAEGSKLLAVREEHPGASYDVAAWTFR